MPEQETKKIADHFVFQRRILISDEGHGITDKNGKLSDASGITISIENSNPDVSVQTNSKGEASLPIDTALKSFTVVYSKPSYGTFKEYYAISNDSLYQLQVSGWGSGNFSIRRYIDWDNGQGVNMGLKSTVTVNSLQCSIVNGLPQITCNISTPNMDGETYVDLFYQKNVPFTSFADVAKTGQTISGSLLVHNGSNVLDFCSICCLYITSGMKSGDTVYMTAYGDSFTSKIYTDIDTKQMIFPNINLSNHIAPISFVLP